MTSYARFLTVGLLIAVVSVFHAGGGQAADRPNILLIVSDDQGYNDLGLLGNGIITPALDRLANEGTRLTNFYVSWPACTPSRASLLTGRYPQRNGIYDMIRNEAPDYGHRYTPDEYAVTFERIGGMDAREVIIPAVLKPAGYKSGIYGKWDLGALKRMLPTSRGFDDFYGFVNTGIDYFTHERYGVPCMVRNLSPTEADKGTYCTFLFQREAIRFLHQHAGEDPFFLYVPFNAPHNSSSLDPKIRSSVQAPDSFKQMYPAVEAETRVTDKYRYGTPATVATSQARRRDYRAAVTCMDAAIGDMLDVLEKKQILDDTIVVFFSDNGGSGGADNSPLRGHKGQTWEGGIRVPCIVRWPGGGVKADAVNDEFLTSLELLPSFAAAAGVDAPTGVVLDGFDWWPTIRGETASPRKEMFWKRRGLIGARVGNWKWVQMGDNGGLFDLDVDPTETNDLSAKNPQQLSHVRERYQAWLDEMDAAEPRGPFRDY
ncbi:sulfatase-like hydrolase/transferase [Stieleria sp. TO1_6]|uniref:sulfatase family protein n=1 Tax=Stieleria tagensis TaxID=2956795 RepID=UPI00209AB848|nr:sulfatase-like hydrolase/transferase [Stieleria tagensis]MCO8121257.1 sulfatase-like hydrolase/transferase [Stieleria tagensis]